jgi:hypothetical protein
VASVGEKRGLQKKNKISFLHANINIYENYGVHEAKGGLETLGNTG